MEAYFDRFVIRVTRKQAESAYHRGDCEDDVKALVRGSKALRGQLVKISDDDLIDELANQGISRDEMGDREWMENMVVWVACGNIIDELREREG